MTHDSSVLFEPCLLDGTAGSVFAVYFRPATDRDTGHDLVYVPPFAEEMNRSRRIVSVQARALARRGIGVLALDLYGTGDSAGAFHDARWAIWQTDIEEAARWIELRGRQPFGLWGLRLGGTLAAQAASRKPKQFPRVILWQPVTDGRMLLNQFLRIGVAAAMSEKDRASTDELRTKLSSGHMVEIAGYETSSELAMAIDAIRLEDCILAPEISVNWVEIRDEEDGRSLPASRQTVVDNWRRNGSAVSLTAVAAPPFWAIEEPPPVPNLIAATENLITTCAN